MFILEVWNNERVFFMKFMFDMVNVDGISRINDFSRLFMLFFKYYYIVYVFKDGNMIMFYFVYLFVVFYRIS